MSRFEKLRPRGEGGKFGKENEDRLLGFSWGDKQGGLRKKWERTEKRPERRLVKNIPFELEAAIKREGDLHKKGGGG